MRWRATFALRGTSFDTVSSAHVLIEVIAKLLQNRLSIVLRYIDRDRVRGVVSEKPFNRHAKHPAQCHCVNRIRHLLTAQNL